MCWGGYERPSYPRGNGRTPCCGSEPTLRVRERSVFTTLIAYVQYECRHCGEKGGLAITQPEAAQLWESR